MAEPKKSTASDRVRAYLRQNPMASNQEVVNVTGADRTVVGHIRRKLADAGEIPYYQSGTGRQPKFSSSPEGTASGEILMSPEGIPIAPDDEAARKAVEQATGTQIADMTPEQVRGEMIKLLRARDTPPPVKVSAAALLEKIRVDTGDELGPGAPLTKRDAIHRMVLMMQAFGLELVLESLQTAFQLGAQNGEDQDKNTLDLDTDTPPPPSSEASLPPNDDTGAPHLP